MVRYLSSRRALMALTVGILAVSQCGPSASSSGRVYAATSERGAIKGGSSPSRAFDTTTGSSTSGCAPLPLGVATPYNAFILGNAVQSSADTQGLLAVGGNLTLTDYSVGEAFSRTVPYTNVLTVGGGLSFTRGVISGNAVYGITQTLAQVAVSGTVGHASPPPLDFNAAAGSLTALADDYARLRANGTVVFNRGDGNDNLTSVAKGLTIFDITGTIPAQGTFRITGNNDGQSDQTFLINVGGSSNQLVDLNVAVTGIDPSRLLFNVDAATSLAISGDYVAASILAPRAAVTFTNAAVEGTLVAASLTGSGQFNSGQLNQPPFSACLPPVGGGLGPSAAPTTAAATSTVTTTPTGSIAAPPGANTAVPIGANTGVPTATSTATTTPTTATTTPTTATGTATQGRAGAARPKTKPRVEDATKVITKTRTVVVYKTVTRYKYVTITRYVTKVRRRTVVDHKTVVTYKTVVKPVTKVSYRVVTIVHHVTKIQQVRALRIVRQPVTGRFGGPQQAWRGAIPAVEARLDIARLGISQAPVWARDFIPNGWNSFTYDIVPRYGATRFGPSARFGQPGLSMLSGHDDEFGSIFRDLGLLRMGDAIVVNQGMHIYRYVVTSVRVVTPDNVAMLNAPYARPTLALISCTPYMVDTHRVVVIAQMQH